MLPMRKCGIERKLGCTVLTHDVMTSNRTPGAGSLGPKAGAIGFDTQGDHASLLTWQRQRRLDSIGVLRERFHTVGKRREEASAIGKGCRVALVAWPLVALAGIGFQHRPLPIPSGFMFES